ncbi:unnamed protein product [Meganyctiphanes norvegica]|uniref:Uncharacterized protein n=1 Tax=Meganyctiphanes norvegica TaxID=48144 RepID=A0AAV2RDP5_MEGNR
MKLFVLHIHNIYHFFQFDFLSLKDSKELNAQYFPNQGSIYEEILFHCYNVHTHTNKIYHHKLVCIGGNQHISHETNACTVGILTYDRTSSLSIHRSILLHLH